MTKSPTFGVNHMVTPKSTHVELFDLALAININQVELRNDLNGVAIANGTSSALVRADAKARNMTILTINSLQRFNQWNSARADEARYLVDYAEGCGARAVVLCPVNDAGWQPETADHFGSLHNALNGLAPILNDARILGLVEPLGFAECSLRSKREVVEAIEAIDGRDTFGLVHDTFHHHVAGESEIYPQYTGIVHISGVEDPALPTWSMQDAHRALIGPRDRISNVAQIRTLLAGGYRGPFSFEPFSAELHAETDIGSALTRSIEFIEGELHAAA